MYGFFIVHIAMCRVLVYGEDTEIHIQLFGESGAPMPVQSHVDGAKFAAFIDEAVADSIRELEVREDDMSGVSIAVLQNVEGKSMVETMSPEFVNFIGDAYRSLKYTNHLEKP